MRTSHVEKLRSSTRLTCGACRQGSTAHRASGRLMPSSAQTRICDQQNACTTCEADLRTIRASRSAALTSSIKQRHSPRNALWHFTSIVQYGRSWNLCSEAQAATRAHAHINQTSCNAHSRAQAALHPLCVCVSRVLGEVAAHDVLRLVDQQVPGAGQVAPQQRACREARHAV